MCNPVVTLLSVLDLLVVIVLINLVSFVPSLKRARTNLVTMSQ